MFPADPVIPEMTLLDVMSRWRASEEIFQAYELEAGTCLRCHALAAKGTWPTWRLWGKPNLPSGDWDPPPQHKEINNPC